jgi:hypothetical protein
LRIKGLRFCIVWFVRRLLEGVLELRRCELKIKKVRRKNEDGSSTTDEPRKTQMGDGENKEAAAWRCRRRSRTDGTNRTWATSLHE